MPLSVILIFDCGTVQSVILFCFLCHCFLSCDCVILNTNKGGQINFSVSHGPNKAFLVSDSCRSAERNPDVTDDSIETIITTLVAASFRLITGFLTRVTRRVQLVGQELFTLPEHLSSPPVFSGCRVTRSLVLCFADRCLSFYPFSFGHCVVLSSSITDSDYLPLVSSNSSQTI